jgi:hypothetical protein
VRGSLSRRSTLAFVDRTVLSLLKDEAVELLAKEVRDVFSLTFYHGRKQAEIAELLGVSDRQVRRLWREACLRLNDVLDLAGLGYISNVTDGVTTKRLDFRDDRVNNAAVFSNVIDTDGESVLGKTNCYGFPAEFIDQHTFINRKPTL